MKKRKPTKLELKLQKELNEERFAKLEAVKQMCQARAHYLSLALTIADKNIDTRIGHHGPLFWEAPDYAAWRKFSAWAWGRYIRVSNKPRRSDRKEAA